MCMWSDLHMCGQTYICVVRPTCVWSGLHVCGQFYTHFSLHLPGVHCAIDSGICDGVRCPHGGACIAMVDLRYSCHCEEPYTPDCTACINGEYDI